jgi:hypothetical protein
MFDGEGTSDRRDAIAYVIHVGIEKDAARVMTVPHQK